MSDWYSRAREEDGRTDEEVLSAIRSATDHDTPIESPTKRKFRDACHRILITGRVPFPTELNQIMGWGGRQNEISGRYTAIRREELLAHGWVKDELRNKWVRGA